jgi:hypothetical protein
VFLRRDGRATIASLLAGWRTAGPLVEVCAAQWCASVEAVLAAAPALRSEGRFHEVGYEGLVRAPRPVLGALCERLGVPWQEDLLDGAGGLRIVNQVRAPQRDKWREASAKLAAVLPCIAPPGLPRRSRLTSRSAPD